LGIGIPKEDYSVPHNASRNKKTDSFFETIGFI
jgi:hypothetical protein